MLQEEEARWEVKRSSLKDKIKAVKQSAAVPSSGSETVTAAVQEQVEAVMEEEEGHADDAGLSFAQKMRAQMVAKRKARGDTEMVAAAARRPTDQQHDINKVWLPSTLRLYPLSSTSVLRSDAIGRVAHRRWRRRTRRRRRRRRRP
jgi:hypothetical protein